MPPRTTTELQEKELVRRYMEGEATSQLVLDYQISDTGVRNILRRHGVTPSHGQRPLTEAQKQEALELVQAGFSMDSVSRCVGATKGALSKVLRRDLGLEQRPSLKRHLLSPEQRVEVARRYREYATYEELRKEFDCSSTVIKSALTEHSIHPRSGWAKYRTVDWTDRKGRVTRFKSSWEKAYAERLDAEGADWEYEARWYPLEICRQYAPDFAVYREGQLVRLVEIKGWMDRRTENRYVEFIETYPTLPFELLGPAELAKMGVVDLHWTNHPQAGNVTRAVIRLRDLRFQQNTAQ